MNEDVSIVIKKQCTLCKEFKPLTEFYKQRQMRDELKPRCKACEKIYEQWYYRTHKIRILRRHREWYAQNCEEEREKQQVRNRARAIKQRREKRNERKAAMVAQQVCNGSQPQRNLLQPTEDTGLTRDYSGRKADNQ